MKKRIMKPAMVMFLLLSICTISFYACSKSGNNYGNGGGNNMGKTVSIKGFAFSAATLTITKGTTVTWTNNDAVAHTVTADDASFDSGNMAPGATFSHTFASDGTVAYHCAIHTSMKASVVVAN